MHETKRQLRAFLCHASQDKPTVRELAQRLASEGWIDPWLDEKKLLPGQDWRSKIEEAVEISDIVLICLSANSVSKEGFVQKELRYAREIALEKPEGSIFLIPLRIEDCDVPRGLRFYQWADYYGESKEDAYNALLESLRSRYEQKLKLEEQERSRQEGERLKREIAERDAYEQRERELAARIARDTAEREAAEEARREETARAAAEKAGRERARRDLAQKNKREKAEHGAALEAELDESFSRFFAPSRPVISSPRPFLPIAGVIGILIVLFWVGSLAMPHLLAILATAFPSATLSPTEANLLTATPRPSAFSVYDDFSTGSFGKTPDRSRWDVAGNSNNLTEPPFEWVWQNGYMSVSGTNCDCPISPSHPVQWRIDQLGKLQADLRIDKVTGGYGYISIIIATDLSNGMRGWRTQCTVGSFDGINAQAVCEAFVSQPYHELLYQTDPVEPISFGQFYTISIQLEPDASAIRYYADDKLIGIYKPPEKILLANAKFFWSIDLFSGPGVTAIGAVDNVMVGEPLPGSSQP